MQQYTAAEGGRDATTSALALVVDAELFRLDAVVRWLDAADARLAPRSRPNRTDDRAAVGSAEAPPTGRRCGR